MHPTSISSNETPAAFAASRRGGTPRMQSGHQVPTEANIDRFTWDLGVKQEEPGRKIARERGFFLLTCEYNKARFGSA